MSNNNYKITGIKIVKNFQFLLEEDFDLVFFDIEETVFKTNFFYDALSNVNFYNIFIKLIENLPIEKRNKVKSTGYHFERFLTDKRIPDIIKKLQKKQTKVYALTSGFFSEMREKQLNKLNIYFEKIIYAEGKNKGPILLNFIKNEFCFQNKDLKIAFIDNHLNKILNIKNVFNENKIPIKLFWYNVKVKNIINNQDFQQKFKFFWLRVINNLKFSNN